MGNHQQIRKSPFLLFAVIVLPFALAVYIGAYFANCNGKVIYITTPQRSKSGFVETREVPRYRFAQLTSEVIFWPIDRIDGYLRPNRLLGEADWRDEWW